MRGDEFVLRRKKDGRTLEIVTKEDTYAVLTLSDVADIASWGRCKGCNHLIILHCYHCCEQCQVDGCNCNFVKM